MNLTPENIFEKLNQELYAIMVTANDTNVFTSRTMHFGYSPERGIFLLTHKGSDKLQDIESNTHGLLHISKIEQDITLSYDISISGNYQKCNESSPYYKEGFEILAKNNPQVLGLLNSEARFDYQLLLFKISEIRGWSYLQIINGEPKTIIKGLN